jgi:dienelactone hydrolase
MTRAFRPDLASRRDLAAAAIPVERIRGPVLLLSAGDDRGWPSSELSDIALRRLERHAHPFPFQHVRYPDVGHALSTPPYGPTELVVPGSGVRFALGGTVPATSRARADAWLRTIEWFAEHLPA